MSVTSSNRSRSGISSIDNQSYTSEVVQRYLLLTDGELRKLTQNQQKQTQQVIAANDEAVEALKSQNIKATLVSLCKAQKILEFAACSGWTVDRKLIICVFLNYASAYQRVWDLKRCAKYLDAVLYNIQSHNRNQQELRKLFLKTKNMDSKIATPDLPVHDPEQYLVMGSLLRNRFRVVQYYLQYCAVNSQLKNHSVSLQYSKKALLLMSSIISDCYNYLRLKTVKDQVELAALTTYSELLKFKLDLCTQKSNQLERRTRHYLMRWDKNIKENQQNDAEPNPNNTSGVQDKQPVIPPLSPGENMPQTEQQLWKEEIRTFSMTDAVRIGCEIYDNFCILPSLQRQIRAAPKKCVYFSICFYTIAAELRLFELAYSPDRSNENYKSQLFKVSQLYHLSAILVYCKFIPESSPYIHHILNNFRLHYKVDLRVPLTVLDTAKKVPESTDSGLFIDSAKMKSEEYYKTTNKRKHLSKHSLKSQSSLMNSKRTCTVTANGPEHNSTGNLFYSKNKKARRDRSGKYSSASLPKQRNEGIYSKSSKSYTLYTKKEELLSQVKYKPEKVKKPKKNKFLHTEPAQIINQQYLKTDRRATYQPATLKQVLSSGKRKGNQMQNHKKSSDDRIKMNTLIQKTEMRSHKRSMTQQRVLRENPREPRMTEPVDSKTERQDQKMSRLHLMMKTSKEKDKAVAATKKKNMCAKKKFTKKPKQV